MAIRLALMEDIPLLDRYDRHISREELINSIRLGRVYICEEEDGRFAGWLRYGFFWDNTPFMNMLYLLEGSRGRGYGRAMTLRWEEDMRSLGYETVMTSTVCVECAQHFYYRLGYKTIGGFALEGDPYEIILAKKL